MSIVYTLEGGERLSKEQFLKYFEKKVRKTIRVHKLIGKKEKILVACSGGKDSMTVLYLMNKVVKNRNVSVEALHIDQSIGEYSKINKKNVEKFCKDNKIPLHLYSFREEFGMSHCFIQDVLKSKGIKWKSCTTCGVLRRYMMNRIAKELKATKIVTGHNLDDEAQTVLMNIFNNRMDLLARLGPKTGIRDFKGFVSRIKPLYMCGEEEVRLYSKLMKFPVNYESCPCRTEAYRKRVLDMLDRFESKNKGTKYGIVNSYLKLSPILKEKYSKGEVKICSKCGEPAAQEVCNTCKIISMIKS